MSNIKCIVCKKELKRIMPDSNLPSESGMWNDAGVHEFIPGYGSKYDMTKFIVGICDDCIEKQVKTGGLIKDGKII